LTRADRVLGLIPASSVGDTPAATAATVSAKLSARTTWISLPAMTIRSSVAWGKGKFTDAFAASNLTMLPTAKVHHSDLDIVQAMDRAADRLARPTIRADDWPYPRSVIAGTDAFVCRDLAGLRGRTGDVMRLLWNRNGTVYLVVTVLLRRVLNIMAIVFKWSITTLIRANLLSERFSKRAPGAIRILFLACCQGQHDRGATQLIDKI
jgi:hypothetical protein